MQLRAALISALTCWNVLVVTPLVGAETERPETVVFRAKRTATDANFRNDQAGLLAAIAELTPLHGHATVGVPALYHTAWTEWMLAASQLQAQQTADALASLAKATGHLDQALDRQPDLAESHILAAWVLLATATTDRSRFPELAPRVRTHRERARELAPGSPRLTLLDATLTFYSRQPEAQTRGLALWHEALRLLAVESQNDPLQADWGRTLAEGWLANLYLSLDPPRLETARDLAERALRERSDYWYVRTQILPRLTTP